MPLTDPELDLLREMLEDDPADPAFLQVGEELVRRARWADAQDVLARGLASVADSGGFALLARAALETGCYDVAVDAITRSGVTPGSDDELARLQILILERSGQVEEARTLAAAFQARRPGDLVVLAVLERLDAPPPEGAKRGLDPFYTVERAERYALLGRADRAARALRRVQRAHPNDVGLEARLRQLASSPVEPADDLSEELTNPDLVAPDPPDPRETAPTVVPQSIAMPPPSIGSTLPPAPDRRSPPPSRIGPGAGGAGELAPEDRSTQPGPVQRVGRFSDDSDEEDTDLKLPRDPTTEETTNRRKRRSLIRR